MFNKNELRKIKETYEKAVAKDIATKEHEGYDENLFNGIYAFWELFHISADEFSINKLDEDMTTEEYLSWGPPEKYKLVGSHHLKENPTNFNQEQRRYICNLMHQVYETKTMTKDAFLKEIEIK